MDLGVLLCIAAAALHDPQQADSSLSPNCFIFKSGEALLMEWHEVQVQPCVGSMSKVPDYREHSAGSLLAGRVHGVIG